MTACTGLNLGAACWPTDDPMFWIVLVLSFVASALWLRHVTRKRT